MASPSQGVFGAGSTARQLFEWQVIGQAISVALGPSFALLAREVNKILPSTPLSPADLADMVVRNIVEHVAARSYAAESGIAGADFDRLVHSAGEPPSLTEAIELLRRGVISRNGTGPDSTSFEQIIAESRMFTKYTDAVLQLGDVPLTPGDAVDAVVRNQIPYDEGAREAFLSGVSADHFRVLVNERGNPPSPVELNVLHNRGLIPLDGTGPDVLSVHQGIAEGDTKDKWWRMFAALAEYIPPARTVVALVREGVISDEEAIALLKKSGLTDELAHKYVQGAHVQKAQVHKDASATEIRTISKRAYLDGQIPEARFRELLESIQMPSVQIDEEVNAANLSKQLGRHTFSLAQVKRLRQHGEIDDAQARTRLEASGWNADDAVMIIADWVNEARSGHTGLTESRILAYLESGVIDAVKAYDLLREAGVSANNAEFLVQHPSAGTAHKVHGNTAGDIIAAYKDDILTQDEAATKLQDAGETTEAASLKLQVANVAKNRGPKRKGPGKSLTEAQILEAFRLGFAADTWAVRELVAHGHSDADAALLVAIEETKAKPSAPPSWSVLT